MKDRNTLMRIAKERMVAQAAIRSFFIEAGYVEVDVPVLTVHPDLDPTIDACEVETTAKGKQALMTSPEYQMKQLLGKGMEKVFYLGPVFRKEELHDSTHRTQFTMLEWYEAGKDYIFGMEQTETLIHHVAQALEVSSVLTQTSWKRLTVQEVFKLFAGVDDIASCTKGELTQILASKGQHTHPTDTWSDVFYRLFVSAVEPELAKEDVCILKDYPIAQAALAAPCKENPNYAQRFEVFTRGLELCNAYTELTNADEQRKRFEEEQRVRRELGKPVWEIDEALLSLLPSIPNPTFGNALGVERLIMALLGKEDIADTLLFS